MVVTPNTQAIQRRYQNVVKDSTRQLQYNMILGRKLCVPPPSMDSPPPTFPRNLVSGTHPIVFGLLLTVRRVSLHSSRARRDSSA